MKIVFTLVLFFATPDHPEPHFKDGWGPREVNNYEDCVKRAEASVAYVKQTKPNWELAAYCFPTHKHPLPGELG